MASDVITVAGLGRPFVLGMLYNAFTDELICSSTLWDDHTLREHTVKSPNTKSTVKILACDSIESRCSLLGLEPSLKASFFSGLLEVEGSGKYLTDQKAFKNQSRVAFQYEATTSFKALSTSIFSAASIQQRNFIKNTSATHIVTSILFGANALFAFDSDKLDSSQVKDIQASMINKINKINVDGKLKIDLTKEEKDLKFSCKFFGDFILDGNPTTFEEAIKTIVELPKMLKEMGENAVPVKVWLTPLKTLEYGGAVLVKEISVDSLRKIENTLEALMERKQRCNECLVDVVVKNFPQIKKHLHNFQKLCSDKISELQRTLKRLLPSIREGKEDESSLKDVFDDLYKSPFSLGNLSKWLDYREREINIIRPLLGMMEGIKIVQNTSELDREVFAPGIIYAFCFVFTSLESADPNLDAKANFLNLLKDRSANEDRWYYSDDTLDYMKKAANIFMDLHRAYKNSTQLCFLVAAIQNQNYQGATIYQYKEGRLITDNFSKPKILDPKTIRKRSDFLWHYCNLTLDPNTANNYLTLSEGNKKAECGKWQTYPDCPERFNSHPQVLCQQPLTGCHYWEIEWNAGYILSDAGIGVTYKEIGRKGKNKDFELGCNKISWYFGADKNKSFVPFSDTLYKIVHKIKSFMPFINIFHKRFVAYHDNKVGKVFSVTGLSRVGVYLDWPAGTLSFYDVSSNSDRLNHHYTFQTTFTEPVYPGFYVYYPSNYASLCPASQMMESILHTPVYSHGNRHFQF